MWAGKRREWKEPRARVQREGRSGGVGFFLEVHNLACVYGIWNVVRRMRWERRKMDEKGKWECFGVVYVVCLLDWEGGGAIWGRMRWVCAGVTVFGLNVYLMVDMYRVYNLFTIRSVGTMRDTRVPPGGKYRYLISVTILACIVL